MAGVIYLQTPEGLLAMEPRVYELEEVLQTLLAGDARLLRGASTGDAARRRWILIARESPVHGASGQSWSADHVFVDDQGVPTVVEVKRGSNTQLRREVVGQLLDYASNLAASTTAEEMRLRFEGRIREKGGDPAAVLPDELGISISADEFWALVGENLARGRIRGYFVADEIPEELRRIVEYLNRQVGESRYLALEVPQFQTTDGTMATFVPQIVAGSLEPPAASSSAPLTTPWTEEQVVASMRDPAAAAATTAILEWAHERDLDVRGGHGVQYPTLTLSVRRTDHPPIVRLWGPNGSMEFQLASLKPPLDNAERREAFLHELTSIPGMPWGKGVPPGLGDRYPGAWLAPFAEPQLRSRLLSVFDALVDAYGH